MFTILLLLDVYAYRVGSGEGGKNKNKLHTTIWMTPY